MTITSLIREPGWPALFWEAFTRSRNPMVLLDGDRRHVEVNGAYLQLAGYAREQLIGVPVYRFFATGPMTTEAEWRGMMRQKQFTGVAEIVCADGRRVRVEFAGHPEKVTGVQLVLCVILRATRARQPALRSEQPRPVSPKLSSRELEVVELIAMGLTGPEIAGDLHLAHNTVRTHVRNAMVKLGARSRAELVAKALGEILWRHQDDGS